MGAVRLNDDSVISLLEILSCVNASTSSLLGRKTREGSIRGDGWLSIFEREPRFGYYVENQNCQIYHSGQSGKCDLGQVYVLQCGDLYKIGFTRSSIKDRIDAIKREHAVSGKLVHVIYSNCASGLERYIHDRFRSERIYSEFFYLSTQDLAWIRSIAFFNKTMVLHHDLTASVKFFSPIRMIPVGRLGLNAATFDNKFLRMEITRWMDKTLL